MSAHGKKMIAPIIITIILILYYAGLFFALMLIEDIPLILKVVFGVIPIPIAAVSIYVLVERIKEIRSGEEDDLSKY